MSDVIDFATGKKLSDTTKDGKPFYYAQVQDIQNANQFVITNTMDDEALYLVCKLEPRQAIALPKMVSAWKLLWGNKVPDDISKDPNL